jgi:hypothetical protein
VGYQEIPSEKVNNTIMPSNVSYAAPATVLPRILARQFSRSYERATLISEYKNGERQAGAQVAADRSRWRFSGRLTNTLRQALRAFYVARGGMLEAFYMYDPWESDFAHDPDGEETVGRHTVRFDCNWQDALELSRSDISLELVEIA